MDFFFHCIVMPLYRRRAARQQTSRSSAAQRIRRLSALPLAILLFTGGAAPVPSAAASAPAGCQYAAGRTALMQDSTSSETYVTASGEQNTDKTTGRLPEMVDPDPASLPRPDSFGSGEYSDGSIPTNRVITLRFTIEDTPVEGASFACRRAGDIDDFREIDADTVEQVLRQIGQDDGTSDSSVPESGSRYDIFSVSGVTDESGELTFRDLPEGVFIITGDDITTDSYVYMPQAFLMSSRDPETEEPLTAQVKYERSGGDPEQSQPADSSSKKTVSEEKKLPQTGLLWLPVRLLCAAGLSLIAAGKRLSRKTSTSDPVRESRRFARENTVLPAGKSGGISDGNLLRPCKNCLQ